MNLEFEKYHLIDRYLRNELTTDERIAFDRKIDGDTVFLEEVEFQKNVNEAISAASFHELRRQMSLDIDKREHKSRIRKWFGGALIFLTASLLLIWFIVSFNEQAEPTITDQEEKAKITDSEEKAIEAPAPSGQTFKDSTESEINNVPSSPLSRVKATHIEEEPEILKDSALSIHETESDNSNIFTDKISIPEKPEKASDPILTDLNDQQARVMTKQVEENICSEVDVRCEWIVENACPNENNGQILIDKARITGGTEPYKCELYQGAIKINQTQLTRLYSGTYNLLVTDAKGCTGAWSIYLTEKPCREKNVSISPAHGEVWEFNGNEGESYYLSILNQAGQLVYKSSLLTGSTNWEGTGNLGIPVDAGLYLYIAEFTNGKKVSGQITIIR